MLALAFVAFASVQDSSVCEPGNGVSQPQIVSKVKAEYTSEAMQNRIEGKVESLDTVYGLDKNAVAAMKEEWVFEPGLKSDKPVAMRIHVEMNYTLK